MADVDLSEFGSVDKTATPEKPSVDLSSFGEVETPKPRSLGDDVTDTLKQYWDKVNPVKAAQGLADTVRSPGKALGEYGNTTGALLDKSVQAFKQGKHSEGVRHALSYFLNGVPGLGSALDEAGNKSGSGDYKGAIADTAALATQIALTHKGPAAVEAAADALPSAGTAGTAVKGFVKGAGKEAASRHNLLGSGTAEYLAREVGLPHGVGTAAVAGPNIVRGGIAGARAELAARAARNAPAPEPQLITEPQGTAPTPQGEFRAPGSLEPGNTLPPGASAPPMAGSVPVPQGSAVPGSSAADLLTHHDPTVSPTLPSSPGRTIQSIRRPADVRTSALKTPAQLKAAQAFADAMGDSADTTLAPRVENKGFEMLRRPVKARALADLLHEHEITPEMAAKITPEQQAKIVKALPQVESETVHAPSEETWNRVIEELGKKQRAKALALKFKQAVQPDAVAQ